jgi:hypothetical protein
VRVLALVERRPDPAALPIRSVSPERFLRQRDDQRNSTPNSLVGQQSICTTKADTAAYFAPAAFVGGRQVLPQFSRSYYQSGDFLAVQAYPFGLQLTAGDPNAKGPQSISVIAWNCGANSRFNSPLKTAPYDCTQFVPLGSSGVVGHVNFPQCWDGTPPTGGNDTSHVAYVTSLGVCPAGFPHPLPSLSFRVHFGVVNPLNNDGSIALSLSSGPYFTMHASFINAWDENVLTTLVNSCINAQVSCGRQ